MCGIAGISGDQDAGWINSVVERIVPRGPDEVNIHIDRELSLSLASTRLSIIDVEQGQQPMQSEGNDFCLVFNGEIYNAPELRAELEFSGVKLKTDHSDTEVLLQLLIRYGEDALPKLNGMFAFAFLDRKQKRLLLARDRLGIKPLYFHNCEGRLAFASELKAIMALPYISSDVDRKSLSHYLSLLHVPGEYSIIEGIEKLLPGQLLDYDLTSGQSVRKQWWTQRYQPDYSLSRGDWVVRLREKFTQAVQMWSRSDVPIACTLSGGLDSSGILGVMAQNQPSVSTYSLGFAAEDEAVYSELDNARIVAEHWGADHHEIILNSEDLLNPLPNMVYALDEPYGGGLPSWFVFEEIAKDFKVAMTGTGGDELFGSYGKWNGLEGGWLRQLAGGRSGRSRFLKEYAEPYLYFGHQDKNGLFLDSQDSANGTENYLADLFMRADGPTDRDRVAQIEMPTQLAEEFLSMTDRFSMAHSLEMRTPILDHEFAELTFQVPAKLRTDKAYTKKLWREVVKPLIPEAALEFPKRGFVLPLAKWLQMDLAPLCAYLLSPTRLKEQGLFKPDLYELFVRPTLEEGGRNVNKVWSLVMFQLWYEIYVKLGGDKPSFSASDFK